MDKEICNKIKYLIKKGKTIPEIALIMGINEYNLEKLITRIISKDPILDFFDGQPIKKTNLKNSNVINYIENNSDHICILLCSDTHMCSASDRPDILKYLADKAYERNIFAVFHSGDVFEGPDNLSVGVRKVKISTLDGQVNYGLENFSFFCKTYFISGNHDKWWLKKTGFDILEIFSSKSDKNIYLGGSSANVQIGTLKLTISHGHDNGMFLKNSPTGYLRELSAFFVPDILQTGHIHQHSYEQIGKTHVFKTGALQDLTKYAIYKGGDGIKSVWWVDIYFDDNGNVRKIDKELETFTLKRVV